MVEDVEMVVGEENGLKISDGDAGGGGGAKETQK